MVLDDTHASRVDLYHAGISNEEEFRDRGSPSNFYRGSSLDLKDLHTSPEN